MSGLILWVAAAHADPMLAASVGYGGGLILTGSADPDTNWAVVSPHGYVVGRVDAFPGFDASGWTVGGSFWGRRDVAPRPQGEEDGATFEYDYTAYGVDLVLAHPGEGWGGSGRLGFGRIDLEDWHDGVLAVPVFGVQAGVTRQLGPAFVELAARGEWGSQRQYGDADTAGILGEDWWTVGVQLSLGGTLSFAGAR